MPRPGIGTARVRVADVCREEVDIALGRLLADVVGQARDSLPSGNGVRVPVLMMVSSGSVIRFLYQNFHA